VPFHSQFSDITPLEWRKVGCGIASVAMLIDFYSAEVVSVDTLLTQGIASNAYLSDAGWTHNGLINLSKQFGLDGASYSLSHLTMESAFVELERVVKEGPVMVSVHYTFKPTNPIPHLAVVTGIDNDRVYYNDPAEAVGQNSISIQQFQSAWKKRYIEIRPEA
jgi:ABC-type bacteriocin/lantibiotic exporter with double-glycine peptidase domain